MFKFCLFKLFLKYFKIRFYFFLKSYLKIDFEFEKVLLCYMCYYVCIFFYKIKRVFGVKVVELLCVLMK